MNEFKTLKENLTEYDFQIFLDVRETLLNTRYEYASRDVKMLEKFENLYEIYTYLCYLRWSANKRVEWFESFFELDATDKKDYEQLICYMYRLNECIQYIEDESDACAEPTYVGKVEL